MRVGLISDTHLPSLLRQLDELGPECARFLETCDLILHGGDIVSRSVLDWCEQFAPVIAARGNHDTLEDPRVAETQVLTLEGWRIGMVHDLRPVAATPAELAARHFESRALDVLIGGDTHVERLEHADGVVIINSGSPNLPHHRETRLGTVGLLDLAPGRMHAEVLLVGHTEARRNPGTPRHVVIEGGRLVEASLDGRALDVSA